MNEQSPHTPDNIKATLELQTPHPTEAADSSVDFATDQELPEPSSNRSRLTLADTHKWVWVQFLFFGLQLALDLLAVVGGFLTAYWLRRHIGVGGVFVDFQSGNYLLILSLSTAAILMAFYTRGLYRLKRGYSKIDEFYRICAATFLGLVLAVFLNSFALGANFQYSRIILGYSFVAIIMLTLLVRILFGWLIAFLRRLGVAQIRILIVGTGEAANRIARRVQATPNLGYQIIGTICDKNNHTDCEPVPGIASLGHLDQLTEIVRRQEVDELIITVSGASQVELYDLVALCDDLPVNVRIYPEAFQLITTNEVSISALTGLPLVSVKDVALRGVNRVIKRIMDIAISGGALVALSPIMLFVALMIKLSDWHGPVFYTQQRVGLDGKPFTILKFRSMRFVTTPMEPGWTTANDPRRTRFGRFIRRFSLDELPQFINVLIGDMSIVGPRPEQVKYVEQFSQSIPRYMRRHKEKAGITGWAQVNGLRGDTSIAERTRYDLYYVENWSVLFDLKIILKTLLVVFTDKNAY